MNDLAEKALQGLNAAQREVRSRPMSSLAVAGLLTSTVVVVAGGQVAALQPSGALTSWLDLQDGHGARSGDSRPGMVLLGSALLLLLLWLVLLDVVKRQDQSSRRVWRVAGAWALPFVVGPPLFDTGVYSYVAFGRLQRNGDSPYVASPADLGNSPIVAAVNPGARGTASSAGPLGSVVQHLGVSVAGNRLLAAVLVFRVLGVLTVIVIGRLAARVSRTRRAEALATCVANPLVLFYVVSSPHLEGFTVAFALGAVLAARRRRWTPAVTLATLAGSVTATGFVAVPLVIAAHCAQRSGPNSGPNSGPRSGPGRWRSLVPDLAIATVIVALTRLARPDGFGWLRTVRAQFGQRTPFAVADAVGRLIAPVVRDASYDDLAAGTQLAAAAAAAFVIGYLIVTSRHRSLEAGIGYALLALALLAPALHPWYLMWGVLVFAPTATGPRRTWLLALSAAGVVLTPSGISSGLSDVVAGAGLAVVAAAAAFTVWAARRAALREPAPS